MPIRHAQAADLPEIAAIYPTSVPEGFGPWGCLRQGAELDDVERDLGIPGLRVPAVTAVA